MQKFFLKNLSGISIAAFLWALPHATVASEAPMPEGKPPSAEAESFNPLETPEARVVEEWERMGLIPDASASNNSEGNRGNGADTSNEAMPIPQAQGGEVLPDDTISTRFENKPMVLKVQPVKAIVKFDNDEGPTIPSDPTDPTAPGDRKGGKHKGASRIAARLASIPIIRMGEDFQGNSGFKVINP